MQGDEWGWAAWETLAALLRRRRGRRFVRRCRVHPVPIIDLELLRTPGFRVTSALTLVGGAGAFAISLANVLYMIEVWGYSPLDGRPRHDAGAVPGGAHGGRRRAPPRRPRSASQARRRRLCGRLVRSPDRAILDGARLPAGYLPAAALLAIGFGFAFPLVSAIAVAMRRAAATQEQPR